MSLWKETIDLATRPLTLSVIMGLLLAGILTLPFWFWVDAEEGRRGAAKWAAELGLDEVTATCKGGVPAKCHVRDPGSGTITELECDANGCQPHQDVVPVYLPHD